MGTQLKAPGARYWLTRLYLAANVFYVSAFAVYDEGMLVHGVEIASGDSNMLALKVLLLLSAIAILDCVVNDIFPKRFVLAWTFRYRHLIYMSMAVLLISLSYITATHYGLSTVHGFFFLHAFFATFVAFYDLFARHGR